MSQIFKNPAIFKDGIDPFDIKQGALGDCYFLAVLSSMAEDPKDIQALFHTQQINSAGCYLVFLYINGVKRSVIIDDYLPVKYGQPLYAKSRDEEVWVCLLEKAWAKLHGNYKRVEGGDPCFASNHVAGVPGKRLDHRDEDLNEADFAALLKECDRREYTMIAATPGQGESLNAYGIVAGHAYSLISVTDVNDNGE